MKIKNKKMLLRSLIFFLPLFFVLGIKINNSSVNVPNIKKKVLSPFTEKMKSAWVDSVFASLSPDERIGQLFMMAAIPRSGNKNKQSIKNLIEKYKVGGLIFFQGGPVKQAKLTNYYQSISKTPLMIAGDYEWGLPFRLDSTITYPRQVMLGAIQNEKLIYDMGEDIGKQCKRIGIHINFAPVIDVNNNPNNPVINSRSFGEQAFNVAQKGIAYMSGMQDNRILAVGKHFPGHGDTDVDSHKNLPIINHSKERLDSIELYPFRELIDAGIGGIMAAHLHIPALDSTNNIASSLSKPIITELLKNKIGFKGLVFTDALGMRGISKFIKPGKADVMALIAGVDVLLMSKNVPKAFDEIKKAIKKREITQKEIDKRCKKILYAKKWFGLDKYKPVKIKNIYKDLNKKQYKIRNKKLLEASLTLAKNKNNIIPFKGIDTLEIVSIAIGNGRLSNFQTRLAMYDDVKKFSINKNANKTNFNRMVKRLSSYDVAVVSVHRTNSSPPKFGITKNTIDFIDILAEKTKVVLVLFGNPYALNKLKKPEKLEAVLVSYNDWRTTRDLSAQLLYGGVEARGKLPVSACEYFKAGDGEIKGKIRLKYSEPAEIKIRETKLKAADSVIIGAIKKGAMPGATVLAVKNGVVFYYKAFGNHTYSKKIKNKKDDIYDLASVTKITATMPAIMKLYEDNSFDINKKLSDYLPELDSTNKKNIVIKDLLTHQAKLKTWIPFYLRTYENRKTKELNKEIYSTKKSEKYPYNVAKNMYICAQYEDTMFQRIYKSKLRKKKRYKYSDLGFYMLYKIIEKITETPMEDYLTDNFYAPLGAVTTGYNPLERFEKECIVPTENDVNYRKQLVQGYVHDYGAAMTGGVNGHAGLFSNANDLAKIMQMYLQKGTYGGKIYLQPETIELFTKQVFPKSKNRRALGFDKRGGIASNYVSDESFGHSGFTGTFVWADPEYDFVYIFLSNRICPDIENKKLLKMGTRTKVQSLLYESFLTENKNNTTF